MVNKIGYVSATNDQSSGAEWGCYGTTIGGTSTGIGSGSANTTAIVNSCSESGIAARICDNLSSGGYSDWFLPSRDELNQMYIQRSIIGGFSSSDYWSSSELSSDYGWLQNFYSGYQDYLDKNTSFKVRCVRRY